MASKHHSGGYLAQVRIKGVRVPGKVFDSRKDAEAWEENTKKDARKLRQTGAAPDLLQVAIADLIDRWRADPKALELKDYAGRERTLLAWRHEYGSWRVRDFHPQLQAVDMRDALSAGGRDNATVNRYLASMRKVWNWGIGRGLIEAGRPWPKDIMLKEPRGRTRYLDDDELQALLAAAQQHSQTMYTAILVSIATGVRQGELLRLKWKDVDFGRSRLTVLESKNGQPRSVHLTATATAALRDLKRSAVVGASVFLRNDNGQPIDKDVLARYWNKVRAAAGLRDFRWHDLRHSCASYLAQHGASLLEIGSVLGHKSPSVTMRYSHLVEGKPVTGHAALDTKLRR